MQPPRTHHHTKRLVLPSGRAIEVVYHDTASEHVGSCPGCGSSLIQPVRLDRHGAGHWHFERRCADCHWTGAGVFTAEAVAHFREEFDAASAALADLLGKLERSRMECDVERFVNALAGNQILPEDF